MKEQADAHMTIIWDRVIEVLKIILRISLGGSKEEISGRASWRRKAF